MPRPVSLTLNFNYPTFSSYSSDIVIDPSEVNFKAFDIKFNKTYWTLPLSIDITSGTFWLIFTIRLMFLIAV